MTRIVDEWVRSRQEVPLYSLPSLREISLLISRMMLYYEKRFPDDMDLLTQFLDIVLYVYKWVTCTSNAVLPVMQAYDHRLPTQIFKG